MAHHALDALGDLQEDRRGDARVQGPGAAFDEIDERAIKVRLEHHVHDVLAGGAGLVRIRIQKGQKTRMPALGVNGRAGTQIHVTVSSGKRIACVCQRRNRDACLSWLPRASQRT